MQRWQLQKQNFAKGAAKHGQGFVETQVNVIVNAGIGKVLHMELVMHNSQDLLVSATSNVDQSNIKFHNPAPYE
ncbi:hypothetical protein JCGZ_04465 [Jatropha curcas]|uniref:Uncharacterized protein n=1 Tax=Jatropha curcas TaxID=180498 RepID=A0A067L220_JATCU|nr:hypothetical protein JCGZ_04465 [Jatropha curcas]